MYQIVFTDSVDRYSCCFHVLAVANSAAMNIGAHVSSLKNFFYGSENLEAMKISNPRMATYSSVLAWRIPGTAEPGGLPSMGSHRVRHD